MERFLVNEYPDGWTIEYGLFGLWHVYHGHEHVGEHGFGIYRLAERFMKEMQEKERCEQQKASCSAQA